MVDVSQPMLEAPRASLRPEAEKGPKPEKEKEPLKFEPVPTADAEQPEAAAAPMLPLYMQQVDRPVTPNLFPHERAERDQRKQETLDAIQVCVASASACAVAEVAEGGGVRSAEVPRFFGGRSPRVTPVERQSIGRRARARAHCVSCLCGLVQAMDGGGDHHRKGEQTVGGPCKQCDKDLKRRWQRYGQCRNPEGGVVNNLRRQHHGIDEAFVGRMSKRLPCALCPKIFGRVVQHRDLQPNGRMGEPRDIHGRGCQGLSGAGRAPVACALSSSGCVFGSPAHRVRRLHIPRPLRTRTAHSVRSPVGP